MTVRQRPTELPFGGQRKSNDRQRSRCNQAAHKSTLANELAITFSGEPLDGAKRRMATSLAIGVRVARAIPGGYTREIVLSPQIATRARPWLGRYGDRDRNLFDRVCQRSSGGADDPEL